MRLPKELGLYKADSIGLFKESEVEAIVRDCAKVAAKHYIPGHSIAGPGFAEVGANEILARYGLEPK